MKRFKLISLLAVVSLIISACGPQPTATASPDTPTPVAAVQTDTPTLSTETRMVPKPHPGKILKNF